MINTLTPSTVYANDKRKLSLVFNETRDLITIHVDGVYMEIDLGIASYMNDLKPDESFIVEYKDLDTKTLKELLQQYIKQEDYDECIKIQDILNNRDENV